MKPRPIPAMTEKDAARFLAKVATSNDDGCHLWTATKSGNGYGHFNVGGRASSGGRMVSAHRVAYTLFVGPIPDGLQIDHTCHNRTCVNPEHLRPVTNKQNEEHRQGAQNNSKSGVRGVSLTVRNGRTRWIASVTHHGRNIHCGLFDSVEDADAAATAARGRLFTHDDSDQNGM